MRKAPARRSRKLKKRLGMYPEQFYLLRKGDIIRMRRSKAPRKILSVSQSFGQTRYIELEKIRPSWTSHPTCLYDANCAREFIPLKVKDKRIWTLTYEVVLAQRIRAFNHFRNLELRRLTKRLEQLKAK